jgi:hypothetical protein
MRKLTTHRAAASVLAVLVATAGLTAGAAAQADPLIPGVTGCAAPGGKQAGGAMLGAVAGGLLGNSVSGHNRTTGTLVGAAVGAAAGSAVGCQMQHNEEDRAVAADDAGAAPPTYRREGYELSNGVAPASYRKLGGAMMAGKTVNLRAAPDQNSQRVGKLHRGERFEALAQVKGSDWILVGRDGIGVGYVQGAYTRPAAERYASY